MGTALEKKARDKAERVAKAKEKDFDILFAELKKRLLENHGVRLESFHSSRTTMLPQYRLIYNDKFIGFADVTLDEKDRYYNYVESCLYRNGAFCVDHFALPEGETIDPGERVRYVLFIMDWDSFWSWSYSNKRGELHTSISRGDKVFFAVPAREWKQV